MHVSTIETYAAALSTYPMYELAKYGWGTCLMYHLLFNGLQAMMKASTSRPGGRDSNLRGRRSRGFSHSIGLEEPRQMFRNWLDMSPKATLLHTASSSMTVFVREAGLRMREIFCQLSWPTGT